MRQLLLVALSVHVACATPTGPLLVQPAAPVGISARPVLACFFANHRYRPRYATTLRTAAAAPPFAQLFGGLFRGELQLPAGDPRQGGVLTVDTLALSVRGYVDGRATLSLRQPWRITPTLIVGNTSLIWRGGRPGSLDVEVETPKEYRPSSRRGSLACEALTLGWPEAGSFLEKTLRAFANLPSTRRPAWLRAHTDIAVRPTLQAQPDGTWRSPYARRVDVVDERDGQALIFVDLYTAAIVGWVPLTTLQATAPQGGVGGLFGALGGLGLRGQLPGQLFCRQDLPLAVISRGGQARTIGTLRQRALFRLGHDATSRPVGASSTSWQVILLSVPPFALLAGHQLAIPRESLQLCQPLQKDSHV